MIRDQEILYKTLSVFLVLLASPLELNSLKRIPYVVITTSAAPTSL